MEAAMDAKDRIAAALQRARQHNDKLREEILSAALSAFSTPIPEYDLNYQRRQILHSI